MEQTHLVCAGCGQKIAGTYFKVDGKIYCFDCNEKMGAKPAKSTRPSLAIGAVIAVVILGLAGLVFYFMAGDAKTVAPMPAADPAPTAESPAPTPSTNSAAVQPAAASSEGHSAIPVTPTPTELPPSAIMNIAESPSPSETTTPIATDTPSISATPLSSPTP